MYSIDETQSKTNFNLTEGKTMAEQKYRKVYIDVYVLMRKDGVIIPKMFIWEDGETYQIDHVLCAKPAASTKVGGRGIRYTVCVNGIEQYMFWEVEEKRWFIEAPLML